MNLRVEPFADVEERFDAWLLSLPDDDPIHLLPPIQQWAAFLKADRNKEKNP